MMIMAPWIGLAAAVGVALAGFLPVRSLRRPGKRHHLAVSGLIVILASLSLVPFVAPAFSRGFPAGLKTRLDSDGVCRQSQSYTCGPAAAVTALRELGFRAEERDIARLAHTTSLAGTEPLLLAQGLQKRYGADGLVAECRLFGDLEELRQAGLTLAVLRSDAFQDHCVTILGVLADEVMVGDPLKGLALIPIEEFENRWQFVGIVLKRVTTPSNSLRPRQLARRG